MTADLALHPDLAVLRPSRGGPVRPQPPVNILLVDDEPKNLTALESVLAMDDRRLVCAGSGPEALKHVLTTDFAVILLDVHMPGMDGFETAELIRGRERSCETPIIFLTAAISGEVAIAKGYSLGAVDYLVKPFAPDILRSKVAVFVELFRKTEQIKRQADALAETTGFLHSVLERQKDAFLAAASHDLKNPLAVVKSHAQLLMRRAARLDSPETAGLIDRLRSIDQATKRLTGMVNEARRIAA